jgi:transposase-like protein
MGFEVSDEALEAMVAKKGLSSTKRAEPQSQEHMAAAVDAGIVHESVLRKGRRKKGKQGGAAWQKATADAEELRAALAALRAESPLLAAADADAPGKTPS